jgi:pyrroloquinoline quinone (PQQ) biosynthesis protein C
MPRDPTRIDVHTDGCVLCATALERLRQAARGRDVEIHERPLATVPPADLEALGIRATPAVVANGVVLAVGCPSAERALSLVKRAELDHVVLRYSIPKSDAIQRFARGETRSEATARALASEFYAFSHEFPLFLAAAISHVRDEPSRLLLVHNLYEEHGNLELDRVHPKLFRQFVESLGLKAAALERYDERSPGVQAAEWVTAICREGPGHRALGALYVTELLFGPTCQTLMAGLRRLHLPDEATEFFSLHSVAEEHHKEQIWQALERSCPTDREWREALGVASDVSRMFYSLFDYIARAEFATTAEELEVYAAVKRLCAEAEAAARQPIGYRDAAYYFGIHAGTPENWFLRALCDSERRSLVTRLPVEQLRALAAGAEVEEAPEVFGASRVYFAAPRELDRLRGLVVAAYDEQVRRLAAPAIETSRTRLAH